MLGVKAIFCKEPVVGIRMFSFLTSLNISSFEEKVSRIILDNFTSLISSFTLKWEMMLHRDMWRALIREANPPPH